MNKCLVILCTTIFCLSFSATAQTIKFSGYEREDNRDINFDVIGKLNNNIVVYKNIRYKHKLSVYDTNMKDIENINLDFLPDRTFNIDFVAYPDFFYMIYQYQRKNVLYCMGVKMDAFGKKLSEPIELDTTQISLVADNKIYRVIHSEDKKKIMIFKIQKRFLKFNIATILFDDSLKLISKNYLERDYSERRETYDNFSVANDGKFVFTYTKQLGASDNSHSLLLVTKDPLLDTFAFNNISLNDKYLDEINIKIDNLNNKIILNSFYYGKNRGSIEGLFTCLFDYHKNKPVQSVFSLLNETLREEANPDGQLKFAFDDFYIRQVIVKKDGGFILTAENASSQTRNNNNNNWNRFDNLYNPYFLSQNSFYYYDPFFGYYRPRNSFSNQSTRFYFDNIIVLSATKEGMPEWSKVIHKSQFDDIEDNFLSFSTMITGAEIHVLFNGDKRYQIISDQSILPDGNVKRNPTLKSQEKGYEFMPKFSKQIGSNQLIVPCAYRGFICFAKIDY